MNSCISNKKFIYGPRITDHELETIEIIDSVETIFETTISWHNNKALLERSYYELLKVARKKHTGEIIIKNIIVKKYHSNKNFLLLIPILLSKGNYIPIGFTDIYARGEVIKPARGD
jgi:hypothetical protein